ncbi:MAG TPA: MBL fold metallo-hydrolase [Solirubrobacteraceae bacterium]|jgi:glyoxylase-like metal-dependent hydrolase (beta-lactamase superfamily II)|nr:MBL fold metallo-hydrolase [Solirubrobacteraceae bacterium]
MRALAVHPDVIVLVSRVWQTTCTAVRAGDEGFVIDSPVDPDELEALPGVLEETGFPVSGLLSTHADWDHLLGRIAFPEASLGCGESTAARLAAEPGGAQRALRAFDEEQYIEGRAPLRLGGVQPLPVPGRLALGGDAEIELHPAEGHTADGTAYWLAWARVLVCGDYLSPVEIPDISGGGSLDAYLATLARLRGFLARAEVVVPGHGSPLDRDRAQAVIEEDLAYLAALRDDVSGAGAGASAALPPSRRTATQERRHAGNVERMGAT